MTEPPTSSRWTRSNASPFECPYWVAAGIRPCRASLHPLESLLVRRLSAGLCCPKLSSWGCGPALLLMAPLHQAIVQTPAIVCLDPEGDIWKRLTALLLKDSLSSQFILTRASESSAELLTLCRRLVPALLVVAEDQLPQIPFVGLRSLIGPTGVQVLLFSETTDLVALETFFRQGCCGVLSCNAPDKMLLKAIRSMFGGELWLPRKLVSKLAIETFFRGPTPKLTRRESDILQLISLGHTNQEIADLCFITRETVRWHIRSLYNKIGVSNRDGAIREAKFFQGDVPEQQFSVE